MRRTSAKPEWLIVEHDDGRIDVWHGPQHQIVTGLQSMGAAEAVVRRQRQAGEKVTLVEADGYRTDITRDFRDPKPEPKQTPTKVYVRTKDGSDLRPARARYLARYGRPRPRPVEHDEVVGRRKDRR